MWDSRDLRPDEPTPLVPAPMFSRREKWLIVTCILVAAVCVGIGLARLMFCFGAGHPWFVCKL